METIIPHIDTLLLMDGFTRSAINISFQVINAYWSLILNVYLAETQRLIWFAMPIYESYISKYNDKILNDFILLKAL